MLFQLKALALIISWALLLKESVGFFKRDLWRDEWGGSVVGLGFFDSFCINWTL